MSEHGSLVDLVRESMKSIPCLLREGFSAVPMEISSAYGSLPTTYEFAFVRHGVRVEVDFMLHQKHRGVFVISIHKQGDPESLHLMEWRVARGLEKDHMPTKLSTYPGGDEEKVKDLCAFLDRAFQEPTILSILRGEIWESTPFDFGDYK